LNPKESFSQSTNALLKIPKNDALKVVNPMVATEEFSDILSRKEKCRRHERTQAGGEVRSTEPLLSTHPTTEPRGGDGHIIKFFRRTSGTLFTFMHIAGVPLRFTTCLCSFVLSGLTKP
jgi:hypothetical protein